MPTLARRSLRLLASAVWWTTMSLAVGSAAAVGMSRSQVIRGAGALAALPLGIEIYSRAPPKWKSSSLPLLTQQHDSRASELVLVLPGAGGPDANSKRIAQALSSPSAIVVEYNWQAFCGDTLRAPYNAQRVGRHLGSVIAQEQRARPTLRRVHLVGISVGAFVADAAVTAYTLCVPREDRAGIRLTFLDPFTARGIAGLGWPETAYGVSSFGVSADEAVCVLNTDDPVPSTSTPLRHCANYDVTAARSRAAFEPLPGDSLHSWPCAWFGLVGGELPTAVPRGAVLQVP